MPAKYVKYKQALVLYFKSLKIPSADYKSLYMEFYFPFPKSAKHKVEGVIYDKTPDWDNLGKGVCDALQDAGIIQNDSRICEAGVKKFYTTNEPRIIIRLR